MRIETLPTSQVIAMNLRHRLYEVTPDAQRWDYTSEGTRYARAFTPEEKERAAGRLADTLIQWQDADPEGYAAWEDAFQSDANADPCAYCANCRRSARS